MSNENQNYHTPVNNLAPVSPPQPNVSPVLPPQSNISPVSPPATILNAPVQIQQGQQMIMQVQDQNSQPMFLPVPNDPNASQSMVYYPHPQSPAVQYYNPANPNVTIVPVIPPEQPPSYQQLTGIPPIIQTPIIPTSSAPAPAPAPDAKESENKNKSAAIPTFGYYVPKSSCIMHCQYCDKDVSTVIQYENNAIIWIASVILLVIGSCLCCIPFLIISIKDVVHYCPNCKTEIARKERF
ncbi:hypothetical protein BCR36DRAFT_408732 [Piromyces finnis]|uniref:LITAF domain-containing protein n=1 Tax=Piromyces finnis TaxID=1754191 RepID=A0A1Y1VL93_9FUNG|nr:hypothetical protein BCR36DRAFT_408732 [Piromyces finnis]|eukprot:ORX59220.1 hypothetical protein BCR36DRAFT_408732 [Piromyces finnis]